MILEEYSVQELSALNRRNVAILKSFYTMKGYVNMVARYVIGGLGHGSTVRDSLPASDKEVLEELSSRFPRRRYYLTDLFIYKENLSEYFFATILDEKLLSRGDYSNDKDVLLALASNFKIVCHMMLCSTDKKTEDEAVKQFETRLGVSLPSLRDEPELFMNVSKWGRLELESGGGNENTGQQ